MSIKKHTLKSDNTAEIVCLGITTSVSEFQLSLLLNKLLSIQLALAETFEKTQKDTTLTFPCFRFINEDETQISLIKNKHKGFHLFANQTAIDYILIFKGEDSEKLSNNLIPELKTQANITILNVLMPNKLRNLKNYL